MAELINGQVVQTVTTELAEFVARKKVELEMQETIRDNAAQRAAAILAELQGLVS